jgi:hypothetical protein
MLMGDRDQRLVARTLLLTKNMRDSGLPPDVLVSKLKKDTPFALRRGAIAEVTTQALDGYARPARARLPRTRSSSP